MVTQPPGTPDNSADGETRVAGDNAAPPDALLGGKYRVERVIGEGAFGRVYLATDTRLRRPIAVKELLATRNATDPELFQRYFGREARAGGAITHPNVVTVYELEIDNHQNTYLVMEYVDGMNLAALLSQVGSLPVERVIAIALDVARGLDAVNEADVVHRDLKPANIMISRRGGAKVGDFGIAQVGTESQRTQVVIGHPGTPLYMSPEQASGFGYLDGRSDLYSLGLVIYEMLAGEPYARRRVPLAQARPETPPALVAIVEKLIQKDPDQRYQRADDVIADLSKLSLVPQRPTATDAYALPGGSPSVYPPGPQGGYAGPVVGVPNAMVAHHRNRLPPLAPMAHPAHRRSRISNRLGNRPAIVRHTTVRIRTTARRAAKAGRYLTVGNRRHRRDCPHPRYRRHCTRRNASSRADRNGDSTGWHIGRKRGRNGDHRCDGDERNERAPHRECRNPCHADRCCPICDTADNIHRDNERRDAQRDGGTIIERDIGHRTSGRWLWLHGCGNRRIVREWEHDVPNRRQSGETRGGQALPRRDRAEYLCGRREPLHPAISERMVPSAG